MFGSLNIVLIDLNIEEIQNVNSSSMFRSYFKTTWRNLMKNKGFSLINIFGLMIGFVCCMMITLYILHEASYDRYHKNVNQLYQLGTLFIKEGKEDRATSTPAPMAAAMKTEFPEIEETARLVSLFTEDKTLLQVRDGNAQVKSFYERKGFLADASFFRLFTYEFIEGNPNAALEEPNTIVLNEEISKKLFGNLPALNRVIHINSNTNGEYDFKVTGVFRSLSKPSQIDARFFLSMKGGDIDHFIQQQTDMIGNNMFSTFLLVKAGTDQKTLEEKFPAFINKHLGRDLKAAGFQKKQFLLPVKDMHLYAGVPNNISPVGSVTYLYILGSTAFFILLIACINFMNLSTARSSKRCVEVGIRKALGADRVALIRQFMSEAIFLSVVAFLLSLAVAKIILPVFADISGKHLIIRFSTQWWILGCFFVMSIITGLLAGSYPALYLSSFQPAKVLKGRFVSSLSVITLRKGLVIFQFAISVILIIASVVIMNQMKYMRSADLGFAKDQQIIIPLRSTSAKSGYASLKSKLENHPFVQNVGASLYYPGILNPSDVKLYSEGKTAIDAETVRTNWVDNSFLKTLGIQLIAGRLFSKEFPADTSGRIVLNETAIRQLGFANAKLAIGQNVSSDWRGKTSSWTIIGVVKDFHFQDLHIPIGSYSFLLNNDQQFNYIIVHAKTSDLAPLLKSISNDWSSLIRGEPFEYSFLDEDFQRNYDSENRLSSIVRYFTLVAIFISCLGLLGLAAFSAEQRIKEIGVRKILGASNAQIILLLSKDFLKLVGVALIIASPVAWLVMNKWLQSFAYRTVIDWSVFVVTIVSTIFIAFLTISFQSAKAAMTNPIKSLRSE